MRRLQTILTLAAVAAMPSLAQAAVPAPAPPQERPVALVGATIHPVDGPDISNGAIVFSGGKITALGANVAVPSDAERIDVAGKHIYPSLIDANTGIGLTEIGAIRATNDGSETGSINPNVKAEVAVNPESEIIPVTRSNGVLVVLTSPTGGVISGTSALLRLDGWTWEDMTIKAPVAMHLNWPSMRPITAWWNEESDEKQLERRDEQLKAVRQAFADARAYMTARKAGSPVPEYDSRWEAMISVLEGTLPVIVEANDIQQIQAVVAFAEAEKIKIIIRGGYDAPLCVELLKKSNIPVIVDGIHRLPTRDDEPYDTPFTVPERLRSAGIRYCITDGGGASNVRNIPYHAATAASYGLPRDEALKAITLYPAQILGVNDRVGSLAVGKDATLFVADGDILAIPTQVELAFIDGRRIDLSDRQKALWEKYKEKYRRIGIQN
jgi:imidazolonepropionase-like amidohydrolase